MKAAFQLIMKPTPRKTFPWGELRRAPGISEYQDVEADILSLPCVGSKFVGIESTWS